MPLSRETVTSSDDGYATLGMFVGPIDHTDTVRVDVSELTTDEVDADGYLKPGVPFDESGALVADDGSANIEAVHGVTVEPVEVADDNGSSTLDAATDIDVAVATIGQVNQDILEDNLGRALTADELTGFDGGSGTGAAQCHLKLV